MVLAASAWILGCSGDTITAPAPRAARVLTTIKIRTYSGLASTRVGDKLGIEVLALDQYGVSMVTDALHQALNDTTVASIVYMPSSPWDYGDGEFIVGSKPGVIVLTATAKVGDVSRSGTMTITVLAADSSS